MPYKEWDFKPVEVRPAARPGGEEIAREFRFTDVAQISNADSSSATWGEFDLLDARNLMERGDYTGAVRRVTSAIEAVVEWRLREELTKQHLEADVERRLTASENDFPGRLRQLCKLMGPSAPSAPLLDEFESTRRVRHDIVHRSRRLTSSEKGLAQRAVDTGRWLFNRLEGKPEREAVREKGLLRSVGRSSMSPRFPTQVGSQGIEVEQS